MTHVAQLVVKITFNKGGRQAFSQGQVILNNKEDLIWINTLQCVLRFESSITQGHCLALRVKKIVWPMNTAAFLILWFYNTFNLLHI